MKRRQSLRTKKKRKQGSNLNHSRLRSTWVDIFSYLKNSFGVGVCLKSCYLQISLISYISALLCISCEYWIVIWFFSVVVCIRIRFLRCVFILVLHKSISLEFIDLTSYFNNFSVKVQRYFKTCAKGLYITVT